MWLDKCHSCIPDCPLKENAGVVNGSKQAVGVAANAANKVVDHSEACVVQKLLFIGDPLPAVGENCVGGMACGFAEQADTLGYTPVPCMAFHGVMECVARAVQPDAGCRLSKGIRVAPLRQFTP